MNRTPVDATDILTRVAEHAIAFRRGLAGDTPAPASAYAECRAAFDAPSLMARPRAWQRRWSARRGCMS